MKITYLEILLHLAFWLLSWWVLNISFAVEVQHEVLLNGQMESYFARNYELFFPVLFSLFGKACLVYGHIYWAFPAFFRKKKWLQYGSLLILLFLFSFVLEGVLHFVYARIMDLDLDSYFFTTIPFNSLLSVLFWGISLAYSLSKSYWKDEQQRQKLQKEKLSAELSFLKSQIHPHFLFNTLNNLYALAEKAQNKELAKGIHGLSGLMRYMLYESKAAAVPLKKEIKFIESIIEMQQLRLDGEDDLLIAFNVKGAVEQKKIAPLLLVPFVENAFKHGIDFKQTSFIKIDLEVIEGDIHFKVLNSKNDAWARDLNEPSGIGLENVKRRLKLLYPQSHVLQISEQDDKFEIQLSLSHSPNYHDSYA